MNNQDSLKSVINVINKGKRFPAMQLVKSNPEIAALISKLVKPVVQSEFDVSKPESYYNINQSQIQAISDNTKSRLHDNKNILQLFPDIELAIQILVSSILSPKDMVKTDIIYRAKDTILPSELTLKLNEIAQRHLENHYNLKDELQTILRDTLFDTGSYITAILPEGILDEIINHNNSVSTESLSELFTTDHKVVGLGVLGNSGPKPMRTALERFGDAPSITYDASIKTDNAKIQQAMEGLIEVSDNFKLLKLPSVIAAHQRSKLKSIIRPAMESRITNTDMSNLLYKNTQSKSEQMLVIPSRHNAKRKSVGRPLVMRLPSESVIPVYIPGDETKHIGYFVLIDIDGNPVTANSNNSSGQGLSSLVSGQNSNQSLSGMLIAKAKNNLVNNDAVPTIDQITKVYSNILEKDLVERLRNGLYNSNLSVSDNSEIYRIMLARTLSGQYTRLVFIPAELTSYFAFKYYENGVGKSYLDDLKILTSLRAMILFSKVMAMTKNSIALTHVNMTLDPNDPDPQKTIELATHEIIKMRQQYFPLGINSPVDLVDWIQRAGFEFTFEGHPGLPQTKFDFETKQMQHAVPDNELDELLRKQTYMALGLSPEIVDNGFNSEFATTAISNNILLSKRVMQLQFTHTRQLTEHAHKIMLNDTIIMDELVTTLMSNKAQVEKILTDDEKTSMNNDEPRFMMDLVERYIENLQLDLPKPDITTIETQITAYDQYVESLDKTLDAWINSDFISSDLVGDINSNIDSIKAVVRNYYLRQWMSENGFMSELNDIVTADEDGQPTLNIYDISKGHSEGIIRSAVKFIDSLTAIRNAANKDLANMGTEPGEPDTDITDEPVDDGDMTDEPVDDGDMTDELVDDTK